MPLPTPVAGSNLNQLRSFLTIGDKDWPLMVAWLVSALIPDMPHPVLFLQGTQGAAKTSSLEVVTALIDPSASQTRTAPRGLKDWIIGAAGSWTIGLDNISEIPPWLSDSLCQAVTGTGFYRRKLRTDSDVSVLAFRRVIAITSIDVGHIAGDLADRMLRIDLDRIPDSQRIDEGLLDAEWRRLHPAILGGLLDTVVAVLVRLPLIRHRDLPRMADFARVLIAVDGVLRTRGYRRYMEMIKSVDQLAVDSDIVARAITERVTSPVTFSAAELLDLLRPADPVGEWATITPRGVTSKVQRVAPSLRALGWTVEKREGDTHRKIMRWLISPP